YGNTAGTYTGTVHFTGGGVGASLPSDYTFAGGDNGSHTFSNAVTLTQAGNRSVTATDTVSGTLTDSGTVAVGAAALDAAVSTVSSSPASVTADGSASSAVTVTALDAYGNPISGLAASLGQGTGSSTIAPASATTDAAGHAVFAVTDTLHETVTDQPVGARHTP